MTNFIKLQYADDLENYTDQAVFLGAIQQDMLFLSNFNDRIDKLLSVEGGESIRESILPFLEKIGYPADNVAEIYNAYHVGDDPDDFETADEFKDNNIINIQDAIDHSCGEFINDILYYIHWDSNNNEPDLSERFLDYLGLQTFTVGYSPWSRVVTFKDHDQEFYSDLYNGWNFYDLIEVDQYGNIIDIVGGYYIQTDQELRDAVKDCFGLDSFKLVDNEPANNFSIEKAETITTYK